MTSFRKATEQVRKPLRPCSSSASLPAGSSTCAGASTPVFPTARTRQASRSTLSFWPVASAPTASSPTTAPCSFSAPAASLCADGRVRRLLPRAAPRRASCRRAAPAILACQGARAAPLLRSPPPKRWAAACTLEPHRAARHPGARLGAGFVRFGAENIQVLDAREQRFFDRLNDAGDIAAELLAGDSAVQAIIRQHPGLKWKAIHVKKHAGSEQPPA